uniref:Uncharacterized protein n=1 Tax=Anguilla anguilla TaxID=7936 RepID=A0A0E9UH78_ANGAN
MASLRWKICNRNSRDPGCIQTIQAYKGFKSSLL